MQIDVKESKEYLHDLAKIFEDDTSEDERVKFNASLLRMPCKNV